jgi:hypothetical protein
VAGQTELNKQIGPFVALGSPEDYVQPEGAIRKYAADEEWIKEFEELARMASCVVVDVGKSSNLRWELSYLRRTGLHTKLLLLTRPDTAEFAFQWAQLRFFWSLIGSKEVRWQQFARDLKALGYDVGSDPGLGAIVSFDDSARAVTLMTGAKSPSDYVKPIREWCTALTAGNHNSIETVRSSGEVTTRDTALIWRYLERNWVEVAVIATLCWIALIFVLMVLYVPEGYESVMWAALTPILVLLCVVTFIWKKSNAHT